MWCGPVVSTCTKMWLGPVFSTKCDVAPFLVLNVMLCTLCVRCLVPVLNVMWPCFQLVWTLYCDIVCLDYGGNVTDACVLSLLAALNNSKTHASAFNAGNSIFLDLIFIQKLKMWVQSSWQVPIHAHPCTRYNWLLHCEISY